MPLLAWLIAFWSFDSHATADGPDFYRVVGIGKSDFLALRSGPGPSFRLLAKIPHDAKNLENLVECANPDCTIFEAITELNADLPRWCRIRYAAKEGWVNAKFLAE